MHQKEPNKFPRDQRPHNTYLDMEKNIVEKDIQVLHPMLSKSQSGVKKRPSMYTIPYPVDENNHFSINGFKSLDREMMSN